MPSSQTLILKNKAVDGASAVMNRINSRFKKLNRTLAKGQVGMRRFETRFGRMTKTMQKGGRAMKNAGRSMSRNVTLPIVAAGATALKFAFGFQKSINRVGAVTGTIIKGKVTKDFIRLEKQAKLLGATTEFSSSQAADAMALLGRAGFKTNEILASTDDVLALASASGMDLAFTADVMAKTIRSFGLEANEAGRVADVLSEISRKSNVDLETLSETFKDSAPLARAWGATLEQTAAITGLLGDVGIQGSKAGTTLKAIFTKLAAPTTKATKVLDKLNIQVTKGRDGMNDVGAILTQLGPKLATLPKKGQLAVINELFGLRGIAGAAALMQKAVDEGRDPVAQMTKVLQGSQGAAKDMQKTMLRGLPGAMARFQSAFEAAAIAVAESGMIETFTALLISATKFFSKVSKANPQLLKMSVIAAAVAAAVGPILFVMGQLAIILPVVAKGFAFVIPILKGFTLAGSIAAAKIIIVVGSIIQAIRFTKLLIDNWRDIPLFFKGIWMTIKEIFMAGLNAVQPVLDVLQNPIGAGFDLFKNIVLGQAAQAQPVGARKQNQQAVQPQNQTLRSEVGVTFNNTPKGTRIQSGGDVPLTLDTGLFGGLQ